MKGVLTKKGICQNQPKPSFFLFCFGESCEPTVSFFWKGNVDVSLSVPSGKPVNLSSLFLLPTCFGPGLALPLAWEMLLGPWVSGVW